MKTLKIFFSLLSAAVLCWGCQQFELTGPVTDEGLTLILDSGQMETKAAPTFETAIDHFDFFFFSDAEGTTPIPGMHGRVTGNNTRLDTRDGQTYAPLRYNTSYLYLVANFPTTISHSQDWTLADLLALEIDSKIVTKKYTALNPYTNKQEETGQVDFCSNLVMDSYKSADGSYLTKLTPQAVEEERTITVGLTRLASKLTVELHVAESVPGTETGETWTPVLEDLQAYYVNALNNKATLDGTPVRRADLTSETGYEYLTYPAKYPLTQGSTDYIYTTDPAYTYPQTWASADTGEPYFKIALVWDSNVRGTANFYYKLAVPRPAEGVWTLDRNKWYKVVADLSVLDTAEDYQDIEANYTVEPWSEFGRSGSPDLTAARFFNVPVKSFTMNAEETLYIPFYSSSTVTAKLNSVSYSYYGNANRPVYTYNLNAASATLPNTASSVSPTSVGTSVPSEARDKNPYAVTVEWNASGNSGSAKFTHGLIKQGSNPTNIFTVRTIKLTLTNADGQSEQITITQHPAIELRTQNTNNVFVNGHFARATAGVHVNDANKRQHGVSYTVRWYGEGQQTRYHSNNKDRSDYWQASTNTSSSGEGATPLVYENPDSHSEDYPYGTVAGDWSTTKPYQTIVRVSAFSDNTKTYSFKRNGATETKTYRIGDPRVTGGDDLFGSLRHYLFRSSTLRNPSSTGNTAVYKNWESPASIMTTSSNVNDGNIIAPEFIVGSSLNSILTLTSRGKGVNAITFDHAQKRAATYQENGYPAGRWRLPTEAEIAFMCQRQIDGAIPQLWYTGEYWCANGRVISFDGSTITFRDSPQTTANRAWARFVYDIWYWGDTQLDYETYWPNMHEH